MDRETDPHADLRMERLRATKSALILEARAVREQGRPSLAVRLYRQAAELECELARLLAGKGDQRRRMVSLLSAGSCFFQARQYKSAEETLQGLEDHFPEAEEILEQCKGKEDVPLPVEPETLQSLIDLMVEKGVFTENEWAEAMRAK